MKRRDKRSEATGNNQGLLFALQRLSVGPISQYGCGFWCCWFAQNNAANLQCARQKPDKFIYKAAPSTTHLTLPYFTSLKLYNSLPSRSAALNRTFREKIDSSALPRPSQDKMYCRRRRSHTLYYSSSLRMAIMDSASFFCFSSSF